MRLGDQFFCVGTVFGCPFMMYLLVANILLEVALPNRGPPFNPCRLLLKRSFRFCMLGGCLFGVMPHKN